MNSSFYQFTAKTLFLFLVFNYSLTAQTASDSLIPSIMIYKIEGKRTVALPNLAALIDTVSYKVDSFPEKNPLMENHWATDTFNPYEETKLNYPFNLSFGDSAYSSPIDRKKVVTSRYGWRRGRPHHGIDIDLISGDDVKAIFDGKVRYVNYHGGHGKTIIIRHENGLETVYAHLSKQLVKINDTVYKGDVIGKGGVTGNARGSHLHLEVRYQGKSINPEYLFDFTENNTIRSSELWVTKKWTNPLKHRSTRQSKIMVYNTLEDISSSKKIENNSYIIKKGDTLWNIAKKYQLSVTQLCGLNSIKKTTKLKIGQRLILN